MELFLLLFIKNFIYPVVDIQLGTTVYDLFHFLEELIHGQPLCFSNIRKRELLVYILNDKEF